MKHSSFEKFILTTSAILCGLMVISPNAAATSSAFVDTLQSGDLMKMAGIGVTISYLGLKLIPATDRSL